MAKTENEIVSAHKRTLEALTGKTCEIKLVSREEDIIKKLPLQTIETIIETHNYTGFPLRHKSRLEDLISLRKLFCLFSSTGNRHRQIAEHLHINIDMVRYYQRTARKHLQANENFIKLYNQIKTDLIKGN